MNVKYHKKAIKGYLKDKDEYLSDYHINHIIRIAKNFHSTEKFKHLPEDDFIISTTEEYLNFMYNVYERLEGFEFARNG